MTATLLTVSQLREHLETGLSDEALQITLDAEEAEIVRRYGAHATAAETLPGGWEWLILERAPLTITSISETNGDTTTVLAADDYRVWSAGRLERLTDGTNPASVWGSLVAIVYVPADMSAQRRLVLVQLATLAVKYNGVASESIGSGDYAATSADYAKERERLLGSLAGRKLWVV